MSFDDQSHYFYVLHQVELDLEIEHSELLEASKGKMDYWVEEWFKRRSNVTGNKRKASEEFKQGVFNWKEVERDLEES
jgi:hypothetical protein